MSQIASLSFISAADVPFLGFWSKPKPRLFRKPDNKFSEFLRQHTLRELICDKVDGLYVAVVFAWIASQDSEFENRENPVVHSVRRNIEGSHWLLSFEERKLARLLDQSPDESGWRSFSATMGEKLDLGCFDTARAFVRDALQQLQCGEALLVSVG